MLHSACMDNIAGALQKGLLLIVRDSFQLERTRLTFTCTDLTVAIYTVIRFTLS